MYAFLILTINDINPSIKKYIKHHKIPYYIHAKYISSIDAAFSSRIISQYVNTSWGTFSIVEATIALLQEAYKHNHKYYILISGDTILNLNHKLFYTSSVFNCGHDINKADQWFVLNRIDAGVILRTRDKYKYNYTNKNKDKNKLGAPDELYFISVLNKEKKTNYINAPVLYTRWILNTVKHPTIFNILTEYDIKDYLRSGCIGIRKCTDGIKVKPLKNTAYLSVVGTQTDQANILANFDFAKCDIIILTPLDYGGIVPELCNLCISISFFYYGTMGLFIDTYYAKMKAYLAQWKKVIFAPEGHNYALI